MKKLLKWVGIGLGVLVVLVVVAALAVYFMGRSQIDRTYDARMGFSLRGLKRRAPGSGVDDPPDVDISHLLARPKQSAARTDTAKSNGDDTGSDS